MESIQQVKQEVKTVPGKNFPEQKFRAGPIVATIWSNTGKSKTGEEVAFKTVSFERSYKDKNDEWQTTSSMRTNDLPKAILVLTKAYETMVLTETITGEV